MGVAVGALGGYGSEAMKGGIVDYVLGLGALLAFVALLSYFWEQLKARSHKRGAWGYTPVTRVVEDAAYRSASLQDTTPNAAPSSVVSMSLICLLIAFIHLGISAVGLTLEFDSGRPSALHLLFFAAMSVAGVALFLVTRRFMGHERIPGGLIALVLTLLSASSAITIMKAIGEGGGRFILAAVFYGLSWFVVLAMWLSPFRAQSERS